MNNLCVKKLCGTYPDLMNLVASPTRGSRILDVIVTNLHTSYDKAVVLPPLQPDKPGHGVPGDHSMPVARPNLDPSARTGLSRTEVRRRRVVAVSGLALMVLFLATVDWSIMHTAVGVAAKLDLFNKVVFEAQDWYCPVEEYRVRLNRKYIVSAKLAKLSKLKSKEFRKNRYSAKFRDLKKECNKEIREIKKRRIDAAVADGKGSRSYWIQTDVLTGMLASFLSTTRRVLRGNNRHRIMPLISARSVGSMCP